MKNQQILNQFNELAKNIDWYFMFSDDFSAYESGRKKWQNFLIFV